ncbi:hypothetical protein [Tropicimonas aquimaris]|uniref:Uncharacterized protein n=1 Tax=Tropicimonas aquimaris TaxID=914152 RepID=A0ABW3IUH8_9RHOB
MKAATASSSDLGQVVVFPEAAALPRVVREFDLALFRRVPAIAGDVFRALLGKLSGDVAVALGYCVKETAVILP